MEKDLGESIVTTKRKMTVERVNQIDETYLDLKDYNCMAVVSSMTYNKDGVMFEFTQSRHRPDRFVILRSAPSDKVSKSRHRRTGSFRQMFVPVLFRYEATANIDTETEGLIQEGLANMRQGRTTIAIAHRLSTIRDAELILVLDKGRIVERGNHDSLLKQQGLYADMYKLQSSDV